MPRQATKKRVLGEKKATYFFTKECRSRKIAAIN
jgi:hypothetical protein